MEEREYTEKEYEAIADFVNKRVNFGKFVIPKPIKYLEEYLSENDDFSKNQKLEILNKFANLLRVERQRTLCMVDGLLQEKLSVLPETDYNWDNIFRELENVRQEILEEGKNGR